MVEQKLKLWLPSFLWMALIFVLSSMPGANFSGDKKEDFLVRKVLHVIEYTILTLTYYRGSKKVAVAVVLAILFAITDEFHQTLVPSRTGKRSDIVIDASAAVITGLVLWKYLQNLPQKLKSWLSE